MTTLWAIRYTHARTGRTWLDHTTVRGTRQACWAEHDKGFAVAHDKWVREMKQRRRKGEIKAVKVKLTEFVT